MTTTQETTNHKTNQPIYVDTITQRCLLIIAGAVLTIGLVACGGGGGGDSKSGASTAGSSKPTTAASNTKPASCPAGELKASNGSCVRECTSDEARNNEGICVVTAASSTASISCQEGATLSGSPELIKLDFSSPFSGTLSVTEICENGGVEASVGHGNIPLSNVSHTEFTRNARSPCDHYIVDVNTGSQTLRCSWVVN